jgi:hypothetical protein
MKQSSRSTRQPDNIAKIIAGAIQIVVSFFTSLATFITILEWPIERKIVVGAVVFLVWIGLRLFMWKRSVKRASKKTLPRLFDLYRQIQQRLHPEFGRVLLKALLIRMVDLALIAIIVTILVASIFSFLESSVRRYLDSLTPTPTFTSTPRPTLTLTETLLPVSTFTSSPSATTTPEAQGIYYMIVLDASASMLEEFETQSKWEAARHAVESILEALEPQANYGLVVVGSTPLRDTIDPCDEPSRIAVPFSPRDQVQTRISNIAVGGGGSLFSAFVLAKEQFNEAPEGTVHVLIYITGSEDACETEDEWADLERYFEIKGESGLDIYSEIIIIDSKDGVRTQTIAERISSLSSKISVQAPQTDFQLVQINNGVINNVSNYVDTMIIVSEGGEAPAPLPTRTSLPIRILTPTPMSTFAIPPPAITFTSSAPSTPSLTESTQNTQTATVTIPPTPACPPYDRVRLQGPGYTGTVSIGPIENCTTGHPVNTAIPTGGSYSGIPNGTVIWELVYAPDGLYYPQSPNACGGAPPPLQGAGGWSVDTYMGQSGDPAQWYEIVAVITDQAASDYLSNWLTTGCGDFPGIDPNVLSQMNITEKDSIRVKTAGQ